jgi:hypothetical protein
LDVALVRRLALLVCLVAVAPVGGASLLAQAENRSATALSSASSAVPATPTQPVPALPRSTAPADPAPPSEREWTTKDIVELVVQGVAAVATAAAALFALGATRAAREAVVGLDRPFLMISAPEHREPVGTNYLGPTFAIQNFGRSTAIASKLFESLEILPKAGGARGGDGAAELDIAGIYVGGGERHELTSSSSAQVAGRAAILGEWRLIWTGRLEFTDLIGNPYETSFCYELGRDDKWRMTGGNAFNTCRKVPDGWRVNT